MEEERKSKNRQMLIEAILRKDKEAIAVLSEATEDVVIISSFLDLMKYSFQVEPAHYPPCIIIDPVKSFFEKIDEEQRAGNGYKGFQSQIR